MWSEKEQDAFNHLKSALCCAPVLTFPNFEKEFIRCTDASSYGIDAVLMQHDNNGKYRVIAYTSRLLTEAEQHVTTRECVSFSWTLSNFCELILGYKIHVPDHYAITEIFKGKNFTGKFTRW